MTTPGGSGTVKSANVAAGVQTLNTGALALANGSGILGGQASNYTIASTGNTGVIIPATISLAGTKVYDGNVVFTAADFGTAGVINTGVNGETLDVTGSGFVLSPNVSAGKQILIPAPGFGLANGTGSASNYQLSLLNTGVITPASLTYVADAANMAYGGAVPTLTGTVTGFVKGQDLASATKGTLSFATPATSASDVGNYAIIGSGLTANNGNYVFTQAAANATDFSVTPAMLTVTGSKVYDSTTGFTTDQLSITGGVNGETVSLTGGTGATSSANVGAYTGSSLSELAINVTGGNGLASSYSLPSTGAEHRAGRSPSRRRPTPRLAPAARSAPRRFRRSPASLRYGDAE